MSEFDHAQMMDGSHESIIHGAKLPTNDDLMIESRLDDRTMIVKSCQPSDQWMVGL
jgi:hypothetical protein